MTMPTITRAEVQEAIAALPKADQTAEAQARILSAMRHIERAQNELSAACADLSSLVGCIPIWRRCDQLHGTVKKFWYRVEGVRADGKFRLDGVNIEALALRKAGLSRS